MKPDKAKLVTQWISNNPQTIYTNSKWKRYKNGVLIEVESDIIKKEILSVLEDARSDGIRVDLQLLNSIYSLAKKHARD